MCCVLGCGAESADKLISEQSASQDDLSEDTTWLEHDFGLMASNASRRHTFVVENNSGSAWTVRKIVKTCNCVVTRLSAPTIQPGKTEHLTVLYVAPGESNDYVTKAILVFRENNVRPVVCAVRAKVREAMTVVPRELSFRHLARGGSRQVSFEIHNFGDHDWNTVSVEVSSDWLTAAWVPIAVTERSDPPRQVWRVTMTANARGLGPGEYDATIVARANDEAGIQQEIPVRASVTSPVNADPGSALLRPNGDWRAGIEQNIDPFCAGCSAE